MAPVPVIEPRVDDEGEADQGNGNRHLAQGLKVGDQQLDGGQNSLPAPAAGLSTPAASTAA